MEGQLATIKKALIQFDERCGDIASQQLAIEDEVQKTFDQLQKILEARRVDLINQLQELTQKKLKDLEAQKFRMEITQAQLSSCTALIRDTLQGSRRERWLKMRRSDTLKQVKELATTFPADFLQPSIKSDMVFSASGSMTTTCANFGRVSTSQSPDPAKCHVTGKGVVAAVVGDTSTVLLQVTNFSGQPCVEPVKLDCELLSDLTGGRIEGTAERKGLGQHLIKYQPPVKGRHQFHVKVEGQHIRGSPFGVIARAPVANLGVPITAFKRVGQPSGVAVSQSGELVVVEWGTNCVSVLSPTSSKRVFSFGKPGSDCGQLYSPVGVAISGEGDLFVTDFANHRVQKFTAGGQFVSAVGSGEEPGHLQFQGPRGIAFNTFNSKVYVTDSYHRVQVLNSDLTFSGTFGRHGTGRGQFHHPYGVACDSAGRVYVADYYNHRVQVFTADGKFVRLFGRSGKGKGELTHPIGIAVDTSGMVYVGEGGNHRVSVFSSDGSFVTSFGGCGVDPGEFNYPRGIAVDSAGVVYVCDRDNNRVQLF